MRPSSLTMSNREDKFTIWDSMERNCITFIYRGALGEASTGVSAFADSLEEFGAGHDDPISVSIGGCC